MSIAASSPMTGVERRHEVEAQPEIALANGEGLPVPREIPTASVLAFLLASTGSALTAYLVCLAAMYMATYDVTLGAWALVAILTVWASAALAAVVVAGARDEFG